MTREERCARFRQSLRCSRGWILAAVCAVLLLLLLPRGTRRQTVGVCLVQSALYDEACAFADEAVRAGGYEKAQFEVNALAPAMELDERTQLAIAVAAGEADGVICGNELMQMLAQDGLLQTQPDGSYGITLYGWETGAGQPVYLCIPVRADETAAAVLLGYARTPEEQKEE